MDKKSRCFCHEIVLKCAWQSFVYQLCRENLSTFLQATNLITNVPGSFIETNVELLPYVCGFQISRFCQAHFAIKFQFPGTNSICGGLVASCNEPWHWKLFALTKSYLCDFFHLSILKMIKQLDLFYVRQVGILTGSKAFQIFSVSLVLTNHLKITSACCHLTYKLSNVVRCLREQLLPLAGLLLTSESNIIVLAEIWGSEKTWNEIVQKTICYLRHLIRSIKQIQYKHDSFLTQRLPPFTKAYPFWQGNPPSLLLMFYAGLLKNVITFIVNQWLGLWVYIQIQNTNSEYCENHR